MPAKALVLVAAILSGGCQPPESGSLGGLTPPAQDELAAKAREVLRANCLRCHGQDGSVEGAMNYVADLGKLVARKKVVPGDPDASRLFKRVADGTMPPPGEQPRPLAADVATLKAWIAAGAPGPAVAARTPITTADVFDHILTDLETIEPRARRFQRYFTLTHLHNAGLSDEELQTYRNALAKLVNSLSWGSKIVLPVAVVDPAKTVLRIDLRWYQWDATLWNRVLRDYPYGILDDTIASRAVSVGTLARLPIVRGDWFVATASRAPLYYDLLQLPGSLTELERQLRVDAVANIQQERVARVGFNGSGVSQFNRILERHDSAQGMYWRSYDFDEPPANLTDRANGNLVPDRRNVFAFPLGPGLVERPFQHAGGEAIFALPNGLHAFFLAKADNSRLDKGPLAIVSDPKRPDRAVEAGVSCMSCHITGILPKADQIRDHLEKNPKAFTRAEADIIRALYPPKETTLKLMEDDAKRYAEVVAKTGAKVSRFEAVSTMTVRYEADIDLPTAAAEVGLVPEVFREKIERSETLLKHVGALRAAGGTVTRAIWVQAFGDVVRELRLGTPFQANLTGPATPDNTGELDPLESRDGAANQIAFTADGKRALVAAGDRSVRFYDVEGRRDLKRFVGHTASVWAIAFSGDEKRAVSGGMDGTARVWDVATGRELVKLAGHTGLVSAVAFGGFTPFVVTGGSDGEVVKWDTTTGQELWRWKPADRGRYVSAVAVSLPLMKSGPVTSPLVYVAAGRSVFVLDYRDGKLRLRIDGHSTVTSLALTPDGNTLVTGGEDGTVRLFDPWLGKERAACTGHEGAVRSVAIKADGRWVLSAGVDGTVRLWDTSSRQEVAVFRKHAAPVVAAAFLENGTQTVSGDRTLQMLPWGVERFLTAPPKPPATIPPIKD